jgi:DNA-binding NarL/FixJ family response regulator
MKTVRLLIVDDQELFAESLKQAIEVNTDEMVVVAIARNGREALEILETRTCDVVLMDVRMPEMDGVQATKRIAAVAPEVKVIVLTTFDDDDYIMEAISHGAKGYVLKNISPTRIISFIKTVMQGGTVMSPEVASKLAQPRDKPHQPAWYAALQQREREVLKLLCDGKDNGEIADIMHIGHQTVKNYISSIYAKMGVHNRMEAFRLASQSGIHTGSP